MEDKERGILLTLTLSLMTVGLIISGLSTINTIGTSKFAILRFGNANSITLFISFVIGFFIT